MSDDVGIEIELEQKYADYLHTEANKRNITVDQLVSIILNEYLVEIEDE